MPEASLRHSCRVLNVARSTRYGVDTEEAPPDETKPAASEPAQDKLLVARIKLLIEEFLTYGSRRITALLRTREQRTVNRKKVYRLMRAQRGMGTQRQVSPKPRMQTSRSRTEHAGERWAMDSSHVSCGRDGRGHLVGVIDGHDRAMVGWALDGIRTRSGRWRWPVERALGHSDHRVRHRCCAVTTGWSSAAGASVRPAASTGVRRGPSRPTRQSRTG